jgi:hypothetical protein
MLRGKVCQSNGGRGNLGRAIPDANSVSPPRRLHKTTLAHDPTRERLEASPAIVARTKDVFPAPLLPCRWSAGSLFGFFRELSGRELKGSQQESKLSSKKRG